jgi:hypothetical protein
VHGAARGIRVAAPSRPVEPNWRCASRTAARLRPVEPLCFPQQWWTFWDGFQTLPELSQPLRDKGVVSSCGPHEEPSKQAICSPTASESDVQDTPGRLSNPALTTDAPTSSRPPNRVQRRLSASDITDICANYVSGCSIDELARSHQVNRTTIIKHLDQRDMPRRRVVRKMTDALVAAAAAMYRDGHSLAVVANKFNVALRTLRREFRKAEIATRPRRGWTY